MVWPFLDHFLSLLSHTHTPKAPWLNQAYSLNPVVRHCHLGGVFFLLSTMQMSSNFSLFHSISLFSLLIDCDRAPCLGHENCQPPPPSTVKFSPRSKLLLGTIDVTWCSLNDDTMMGCWWQ